jgi:hypothetical protein
MGIDFECDDQSCLPRLQPPTLAVVVLMPAATANVAKKDVMVQGLARDVELEVSSMNVALLPQWCFKRSSPPAPRLPKFIMEIYRTGMD